MPIRHPDKARAKSIRADQRNALEDQHSAIDARDSARNQISDASKRRAAANAVDTIDWLALWTLSLAISAMFIAGLVYFGEGDATGAAAVLSGTACIIAVALFVSKPPAKLP